MENQPVNQPENEEKQESIFTDMTDMSGYDKHLKQARIILYILCALQIGIGVYEYFQYADLDATVAWTAFGIDAGIGLTFLACAFWSFKKPVQAFIAALIIYIVVMVAIAVTTGDYLSIIRGFILKIIVIIALVKAIKDARETEELKRSFNTPQ